MSDERPVTAEQPGALEIAERIRRGELSSEQVVAKALEQVVRRNPRLQAFVSVMAANAEKAARAKDRARGRSDLPPFHGVPIAIKDLHPVRWTFTRMGSRSYRWLFTPFDDPLVRTLRKAGFVVLGKTSTSELALMPIIEPEIHGPTRNPWNDEHTSGGSSGGSAVAVAAGMVPVAPGSDGGGSIRIPASYCGIVGLKPTRGLVPNPLGRVDRNEMTAIGPLARTVDDAAAFLDLLTGRPNSGPSSFSEAAHNEPPPLRIRMALDSPVGETDPLIGRAVRAIGELLTDLGHDVVEVDPPAVGLDEFIPIYSRLFADIPVPAESRLQPVTRWFREQGRLRTQAQARAAFEALNARVDKFVGDADVLLTPTTAIPAPKVGAFADMAPEEMFHACGPIGAFTAGFNVGGQPAVSIPAGRCSDGVPFGAQLVGRHGQDGLVLALARQIEQIRGQRETE